MKTVWILANIGVILAIHTLSPFVSYIFFFISMRAFGMILKAEHETIREIAELGASSFHSPAEEMTPEQKIKSLEISTKELELFLRQAI